MGVLPEAVRALLAVVQAGPAHSTARRELVSAAMGALLKRALLRPLPAAKPAAAKPASARPNEVGKLAADFLCTCCKEKGYIVLVTSWPAAAFSNTRREWTSTAP